MKCGSSIFVGQVELDVILQVALYSFGGPCSSSLYQSSSIVSTFRWVTLVMGYIGIVVVVVFVAVIVIAAGVVYVSIMHTRIAICDIFAESLGA